MAYSKVVASLLVALISSLISCVQINAAVINLHNQYIRDRQDVLRLLSMNSGHHKVKKRANHHRRRFWTRPGRTSAWWNNFINGTMISPYLSTQDSQSMLLAICFVLYSFVTVSSSSTSSSVHLYVSAYFLLTFSVDLDIFSSDKLQASTVYTSQ